MLNRLVPSSTKGKLILAGFGVVFLVVAWQVLRAWWYHGVSSGMRSGIVRKLAKKGSPLCRYWMGELVITNTTVIGAVPEVWEFNVDARSDADPLIAEVQKAESSGQRTTLRYRQDKGKWWACSSIEYYVTGVTK
jgi:hypothetical protein